MDEDESSSYLNLLSDGLSQNFLLQNNEEGFTESVFTEIASDWSSEGFPILLSAPLEETCLDPENGDKTVTIFSDVPQNNVILSNDVLVQLQDQQNDVTAPRITHIINGNAYSIQNVEETVPQNEVIQLLNIDGTITTIDKSLLEKTDDVDLSKFSSAVEAIKCNFCGVLFESKNEIRAHLLSDHSKDIQEKNAKRSDITGTTLTSILNANKDKKVNYTLFVCSECGNGYSKKEELKQHMISDHDYASGTADMSSAEDAAQNRNNPEQVRSNLMAKSQSLLKKQQKQNKKVMCTIKGCPLRFPTDEMRTRHENCHVNREKKQFQCPECKEKFSIWRICSLHMWKSHQIDMGLLTCPMCNKFKSLSLGKVLSHMQIHNEDRPFVCASCGKKFKTLNQLKNHEMTHKAPDEVPNWLTTQQCKFCERYFANSKCLQKHIKHVHDKFKQFICNICGHQTSRKAMLQLHQRQHTGVKPHQCQYCDYKTGDHNCLRRHTMWHFGVAQYSCPYCKYQAIQSASYKGHMRRKHPGKEGTYTCKMCTYTTVNLASYLSHVKCHELENKRKAATDKPEGDDKNSKTDSNTGNIEGPMAQEDEETQSCFLNAEHSEDAVDTGGITIPAGFDLQLVN